MNYKTGQHQLETVQIIIVKSIRDPFVTIFIITVTSIYNWTLNPVTSINKKYMQGFKKTIAVP